VCHAIGCHLTQERGAEDVFDDVARALSSSPLLSPAAVPVSVNVILEFLVVAAQIYVKGKFASGSSFFWFKRSY
jgi:hypothetical protein